MTTSNDKARATASDWLAYAMSDLSIASGPRVKDARTAAYAFHAQQAVEKFLKAVLVAHDVDPPRTHDIRELSVLNWNEFAPSFDEPAGVDQRQHRVYSEACGWQRPPR